jgi:aryl-alcohol dehydrogenase-like predicted oxidoreductase
VEYRRVGRSGLSVSALGLGCVDFGDRLDPTTSAQLVDVSLDLGVSLFDTSDNYNAGRSEEILGRALGKRRREVVICTKFTGSLGQYRANGSRSFVIRSCEESLQRLGTDYIDLYTLHHPDPDTPIEETLGALDDLVRQGKVRYLASSNLPGWQTADAEHTARTRRVQRFVAAQMEWSLLRRDVEDEAIPACRHYGLGILPFYPIASGLLTGKYRRGEAYPEGSRFARNAYYASIATESNFEKVERLTAFAAERGHSILELAMSWLAGQRGVSSILIGASRPEQIEKNLSAMSWELGPEDHAAIDQLLEGVDTAD